MGDLARERRARSIHISRGHLAAAAVAWVLWTVSMVSAGYLLGRRDAPELVAEGPTPELSDLPDPELAEVLTRLEATAAHDANNELEEGYADDHQLAAGIELDDGAAGLLAGDTPPPGNFTLSVGLFDGPAVRVLRGKLESRGIETWLAPVLTGDQITYRLSVGGFETEDEADLEWSRLGPMFEGLGMVDMAVVPIR